MDDKPSADVAASEVQESGSTETPRPAAGSDLWQMFAPMTGFFREFFRKDHSQFQQLEVDSLDSQFLYQHFHHEGSLFL